MKKQIVLILPFIILSSFSYAKDFTTVRNESKNTIRVFFTAEGCVGFETWDAAEEQRRSLGEICGQQDVAARKKSKPHEWKFGQSTRNVAVLDLKTKDFWKSTPERVRQRRKEGAPVTFPSDFAKEPYKKAQQ